MIDKIVFSKNRGRVMSPKKYLLLTCLSFPLLASEMEAVLEVGRDNSELSAASQERIDATETATDKIVNEWKVVSKQVEGLKLYNAQKRIQIQAQLDLMDKYDEQLVQVVIMQRQIPPLAQRMLEGLEKYISLDTPFHLEERLERVDLVRASLSNPKVTASEQVRQILEAFNIEAEYGRKLDAYEDTVVLDDQEVVVNILRVGRLGMFYQTKDERQTGFWNPDSNSWEELSGNYRTQIRDGIRMAQKLAPIDMLVLPITAGSEA
jgi:hypothetical protein